MIIKHASVGMMPTNVYLLIDDTTGEAALIDCPCEGEELLSFIADPEVGKLKYILLTHGHYDHIMGVQQLKERTGAEVLIHEADAACLHDRKISMAVFAGCQQTPAEADGLLKDGDIITLGNLNIKVLHTPGHTPGGCTFQVENALFTGDTLFFETIGATHFPGGNEVILIKSVKKLASLPGDYKIYPGHEAFSTMEWERANNPYIS